MPYKKSVVCLCVVGFVTGGCIVIASIALGMRNHTKIAFSLFVTGWIFIIFSLFFCKNYAMKPVRIRPAETQLVLQSADMCRIIAIQQRPLPPIPVEAEDRTGAVFSVPPPIPQMRYPQQTSPRMRSNVISLQPPSRALFAPRRPGTNLAPDRRNQPNRRYEVHFI